MIEFQMFGRFAVRDGTRSLGPKDFGGVKPKQVLQVLLLGRGQPQSKDRIADLLWGEDLPRNISATLETYVSVLRRSLTKLAPPAGSLIVTEVGGYRLDPSRYSLDLDRFDDLMARARGVAPAEAARLTDEALTLVAGEVLADEPYALFAQEPRDLYIERHCEALLHGARLAMLQGDHLRAATLARRATEVSPLSEAGWRKLMLAQYALGRRTAALLAFDRCKEVLAAELGVEVSQETRNLHDAILRDDDAAGVLLPGVAPRATAGEDRGPLHVNGGTPLQVNGRTPDPSRPLYGRAAELAQAAGVVQEALAGRFTVLLLDGAAGMGKTCFLDALVEQVRSVRPEVRIGTSRGHLLKQTLSGVTAGDAFQAALAGEEGVAEVLGAALSENRGGRWRALERLAGLLAGAGAVVLVFDDLHAADTVTLSVLAYLRHRIPDAPVAVVATAPLQELAGDHPLRTLTVDARLQLDVLRREDVSDVGMAMWAKTGGHPQLLTACLKAARTGAEWPPALRDLVVTRAREAGSEAHRLLLTATLFERPFSADELAVVVGRPPLEVIDELEQGVERGILTMTGTRFAFRYQAVRDILLHSMSEARRDLLSRHFGTGGRPDVAAVWRSDADLTTVG